MSMVGPPVPTATTARGGDGFFGILKRGLGGAAEVFAQAAPIWTQLQIQERANRTFAQPVYIDKQQPRLTLFPTTGSVGPAGVFLPPVSTNGLLTIGAVGVGLLLLIVALK